ncbi:MAG TPA: hydroxyphenylacetyl-CoA thioesterase PaaI [Steroidobacteraceae bacterium]|nr:hydroxyphenylacetyl-CoA thioesterase PaaI [Steroidobacteraceae bacterium]
MDEPAATPTATPPAASAAAQALAERIALALFARDHASRALGMRLVSVAPGRARLLMRVRGDMVNGHGLCHGGIVFALADSAFAFACNSHNDSTVAAAASIDYLAAAREGDELTAEASELWRTRRNGLYEIIVSNQRGERIALFRGRSYRIEGQVLSGE